VSTGKYLPTFEVSSSSVSATWHLGGGGGGGLHISEDYNTKFLRNIGNYLTFDTVRRNIPEGIPTVRTANLTAYEYIYIYIYIYIFCIHNPTTAQRLDVNVNNHIASFLHVSGFFGHLQELFDKEEHLCLLDRASSL